MYQADMSVGCGHADALWGSGLLPHCQLSITGRQLNLKITTIYVYQDGLFRLVTAIHVIVLF